VTCWIAGRTVAVMASTPEPGSAEDPNVLRGEDAAPVARPDAGRSRYARQIGHQLRMPASLARSVGQWIRMPIGLLRFDPATARWTSTGRTGKTDGISTISSSPDGSITSLRRSRTTRRASSGVSYSRRSAPKFDIALRLKSVEEDVLTRSGWNWIPTRPTAMDLSRSPERTSSSS
jgi:hypothetical protein